MIWAADARGARIADAMTGADCAIQSNLTGRGMLLSGHSSTNAVTGASVVVRDVVNGLM